MAIVHQHLILGSSSVSRDMVLKKLGLPFLKISPEIDEAALPGEAPEAHVLRLAVEKARKVAELMQDNGDEYCPCRQYWIIASDQVALLNGQLVSKPDGHEDAVQQLRQSSGQSITFYNGLCLLSFASGQSWTALDTTTTHYRDFSEAEIEYYLRHDKPYSCAGSLKSEGLGIALIKKIDSQDPNSLIGLPLIKLCELFEQAGVGLLSGRLG